MWPACSVRPSVWLLVLLACAPPVRVQDAPSTATPATPEAIRDFLLNAEIVGSRGVDKGVTGITRLTLKAGGVTHDAAFQSIDERKLFTEFERGGGEIGFADSYHFNIAGYELAVLVGLGHMVPVTVMRSWRGTRGSLSWWVPSRFDEQERLKQRVEPPRVNEWNAQMYRLRVFSALIHDTDRNLGNILIDDDWKIWMIDFTRAFRRRNELQRPGDLNRCDRRLFARLEALSEAEVRGAAGDHLTNDEIEAVMARRDLLLAHFRRLIAERGEPAVLY